ncbi:hypothetical protein [Halorussus sp. AFM4]|uniref:hypothetical protein n=1 Tax=Halorussus sp. AFM4 TaxID=3421651 RepID=UPI003EBBAFBD
MADEADTAGSDANDATDTDALEDDATDAGPGNDTTDAGSDATDAGTDEFDRVRARAADAVREADPDLTSVYVGLIRAEGADEYYFGNDVDEAELRRAAAEQLGMLTCVLADQSASSVEEIAELAVERAESMDLRG